MSRRNLHILLAVALAAAISIAGLATFLKPTPQIGQGEALVGGAFTLVNQDGDTVTDADFIGKPTALFFGFTFCPDVCPTTLYEMTGLIEALGPDADRLNFAFVSVDWERDGPAELKAYMSAFDPRIVGLSGNEEQIKTITNAYRVYYRKVPIEDGDYTMDHTASIYLMDSDNRFFGTISYGEAPETMLEKVRRLIANG